MKTLTYSRMAAARLRANKRQYRSLILAIFLSIFLVSTMVLAIYGIFAASLQQRYDKVGFVDLVAADAAVTLQELETMGDFDKTGQVHLTGSVVDYNLYLGYYDAAGQELLNLQAIEGRLPQSPGELAVEKTVLEVLEQDWSIGDTVELNILPVDGMEEERTFTLVGFLPERSVHFEQTGSLTLNQFPAMVTSPQEAPFAVGRVATHYVLRLSDPMQMDGLMGRLVSDGWMTDVYGLNIAGEIVYPWQNGDARKYISAEMGELLSIVVVLTAALLLSSGVGISGAMEGMLTGRREEIGVLRALGATKRQIRRMFGRENWMLALVLSPLSVGTSYAFVWLMARFLPQSLKSEFQIWLLIPIAGFSAAVILVSGYLPLVRASKQMPMSVIRDTVMLRRSKAIRGKTAFSPTKLIAGRQIRFHPTRQLGASFLVALMLLCSCLFGVGVYQYERMTDSDYPAFVLRGNGCVYTGDYISSYDAPSLSDSSIRQIRTLNHVRSLTLLRDTIVTAVLEEVPRYTLLNDTTGGSIAMMDDELYQEAKTYSWSSVNIWWLDGSLSSLCEEYQQFLEDYGINGVAYGTALVTMDLTSENLEMLHDALEQGSINPEAIHAGHEVIVVAPDLWIKDLGSGGFHLLYSEEEASAPENQGAEHVIWNNAFTAGQTLPLVQLYQMGLSLDTPIQRKDATVTVGAVTGYLKESNLHVPWREMFLITTEEGLHNMGLAAEGLSEILIHLDGDITLEEEQLLEQQLTAISRRTQGYSLENQVAQYRQVAQRDRQRAILCITLIFVFFSVSVGMIVSVVTRQLHSEGRTIGMLRAVGADERAILGCYSGPVAAGIAGGVVISLGTLLLYGIGMKYWQWVSYLSLHKPQTMLLAVGTIGLMALVCWLACRFFLRRRIREIVKMSIIENIREL